MNAGAGQNADNNTSDNPIIEIGRAADSSMIRNDMVPSEPTQDILRNVSYFTSPFFMVPVHTELF